VNLLMRAVAFLVLFLAGTLSFGLADETVPIQKSRLQELERKAAELDRLTGSADKAKAPGTSAGPTIPAPSPRVEVPVAAPPRVVPPLPSLPPLEPGQVIEADVLSAHFAADPALSAQRYKGRKVVISGEIASFSKPMFMRNYKVVFRSSGSQPLVVCDFYPPDKYKAIFPAEDGSRLVATLENGAEVTLARTGQTVLVEGDCRGRSGNTVRLVGCRFKKAD
jgi:hypothetical protein